MNVTFGCSHTGGTEEGGSWTQVIKDKYGIDVVNHGRGGTGFFQTVEIARRAAAVAASAGHRIQRVILQKPMLNRYPWYCDPRDFVVVKARQAFNDLPDFARKLLARRLFKIESRLLREFVGLFPEARFAYWHYWYDYHVFAPRLLVPYLDSGQALARSLGMDVLGTIIDGQPIVARALAGGRLNSKPFVQSVVDQGWVLTVNDGHATRKHNELVADRIKGWFDAVDDQAAVQASGAAGSLSAAGRAREPG